MVRRADRVARTDCTGSGLTPSLLACPATRRRPYCTLRFSQSMSSRCSGRSHRGRPRIRAGVTRSLAACPCCGGVECPSSDVPFVAHAWRFAVPVRRRTPESQARAESETHPCRQWHRTPRGRPGAGERASEWQCAPRVVLRVRAFPVRAAGIVGGARSDALQCRRELLPGPIARSRPAPDPDRPRPEPRTPTDLAFPQRDPPNPGHRRPPGRSPSEDPR